MCDVQASFTVSLPKAKSESKALKKADLNKGVMMSFVDNLWSMEITGGCDQNAPLSIISVKKNGLARRAGLKVGDVITHINKSPADQMTLIEAQLEIQESGRNLKLIVKGDSEESTSSNSSEEEEGANIVDFWFKPVKPEQLELLEWQKKRDEKRSMTKALYQNSFPWNDRKKPELRASNCFMATKQQEQREIKLKATKERYVESEKRRLTDIENSRIFLPV